MKRRDFIGSLTALAVSPHISTTDPLVYSFTKGKPVRPGRVSIEMAPLAENGHSVAMTVKVDSPMTASDHVRAVHLIAERNPVRDMAVFYLGPDCGRAEVGSRIRLNGSQRVVAIPELSDGSIWSDAAYVEVREAACTDGG